MLIDTMIAEAFEEMHAWSGPVAAAGFLFAFAVSHAILTGGRGRRSDRRGPFKRGGDPEGAAIVERPGHDL